MKKIKAFTLVEAVIVIAVLAVLAVGSSAPKYNNAYMYKKSVVAYKVKSDMQYAQSLAIASRQTCGVVFDNSSESYTLFENGDQSDPATDPTTGQDYTVQLDSNQYEGVVLTADFGGTEVVQFDREGTPSDGNGSALPSSQDERYVQINAQISGGGCAGLAEGAVTYVIVEPGTGRVTLDEE